jgi:hypothetical protein
VQVEAFGRALFQFQPGRQSRVATPANLTIEPEASCALVRPAIGETRLQNRSAAR